MAYINMLGKKPESKIRCLLGFKVITVIDKMDYIGPDKKETLFGHYEWQWRPFLKRR